MLPIRVLKGFPLEGFSRDVFFEPMRRVEAMLSGSQDANGIRLDIREEADAYVIAADVPGFKKDELDITINDGLLTLTAEQTQSDDRENETYHVRERVTCRQTRTIRLPDDVDAEATAASLSDGVLTLKLNKVEKAKPHKIEVTSS